MRTRISKLLFHSITILAFVFGIPWNYTVQAKASGEINSITASYQEENAETGAVSGTVRDMDGIIIPNIDIRLHNYDNETFFRSVQTGPDGSYTISDLPAGDYYLYAVDPRYGYEQGYTTEYYNNVHHPVFAERVPVLADQTTTNIDFDLEHWGIISGRVLDNNGNPLANITLTASNTAGYFGHSSNTREDGTYDIPVTAGDYKVGILHTTTPDYAETYYGNTYNYQDALVVSAVSGVTTPNIDFVLEPAGKITGRVLDIDGNPVFDTYVFVSAYDVTPLTIGIRTNDDGTYTIAGLPALDYQVQASTNTPGYLVTYFDDTVDIGKSARVSVSSGSVTSNIDLILYTTPQYPPGFIVRSDQEQVHTFCWPAGTQINLSIDDPATPNQADYSESGIIEFGPGTACDLAYNFELRGIFDIRPGFIVRISDGTTTLTHEVTNIAMNHVDADADKVFGTAESGSLVTVEVPAYNRNAGVIRHEIVDSLGNWVADFSQPGDEVGEEATFDIGPGSTGEAYQNSQTGATYVSFELPNPSFSVRVTENEVHGYGWTLGDSVHFTIDDPGTVASVDYTETQTVMVADWDPNQTFVSFRLWEHGFNLEPGMIASISNGQLTKTHEVTSLMVTSVDHIADTVSGTAQPNTEIQIGHIYCDENGCHGFRRVRAKADGTWTADFAHVGEDSDEQDIIDIVPSMGNEARQQDQDGDTTNVQWRVPNPRFDAWYKDGYISAYEWPLGTQLTLEIEDSTTIESPDYSMTTVVGTAPWNPNETQAEFHLNGSFEIRPGMVLTISGASFTKETVISNLTVTSIDTATDIIVGTTEPNRIMWMYYDNASGICCRDIQADGSGVWMVDYSEPGVNGEPVEDIHPGSSGTINVRDEDGDNSSLGWNVPNPNFSARLTDNEVHGYMWPLGSSVNLTIDDPNTSQPVDYTDMQTAIAADWDADQTFAQFRLWEHGFTIQPGMTVTMSDGITTRTHLAINLSLNPVDVVADTISGHGSPNQDIWVDVWCDNCPSRHVVADGNGDWIADFSVPGHEGWGDNTFDIQPGSNGEVRQQDAEGNTTNVQWKTYTSTLHVVPTHPEVHGHDWQPGSGITLTIDDDTNFSNGVLYTSTKNVDDDPWCGNPCFDLAGLFDLQVGQYVTMTDGMVNKTVMVSDLMIAEVDAVTDQLHGIADPGSRVAVNIWSQDGEARYVTADEDGNWIAEFSIFGDEDFEQFTTDITYGDNGRAIQLNPDGTDDGTLQYWDVDWVAPPSIPLVFAISSQVDLSVPRATVENISVLNTLNDSLFRIDEAGSLMPLAAMDYTVSPNGLEYTVTLRPDAVWSDGQPVTAQHFVDGILRVLDPNVGSDYGFLFFPIKNSQAFNSGEIADRLLVGVKALDALTLEFTLEQPTSHFSQILASPAALPARQDVIDQFGDSWMTAEHYVSNGLYQLAEYDAAHIVVDRNPSYSGPAQADLPQIGFDVISDPDQQIAAYKNGAVDVLLSTPIARIMSDPLLGQDLTVLPSPGLQYIGLSTQVFPTNNLLVRKALASAINRQTILDDVLQTPWRVEATGLIPPELIGYEGSSVGFSYDPVQARTFLAQAGYPGGQGFPELYFTATSNQVAIMDEVASQWEAVLGITVHIDYVDGGDRFQILSGCRETPSTCTYNGYILGWVVDYPDAYNIINDFLSPDSPYNYTQWDNTIYRGLIQLAVSELDPAQRIAYLQQAEQLLVGDNAVIAPLFHTDAAFVVRPGFYPFYSPMSFTNLAYWSNVDPGGDGMTAEVIGSAGGTVTAENNAVSVEIPPAALQSDVSLSVTELGGNYQITASQEELDVLDSFSIQPHGLQFSVPVALIFAWDDTNNDGVVDGTSKLETNIFLLKDGQQITPTCNVNPSCDMNANLLTVEVSSLSHFELVAPANAPPTNIVITAPTGPVPISEFVTVHLTFNDAEDNDAHSIVVEWGDGTESNMSTTSLSAAAVHQYQAAGVYTIKTTVTDSAGESASATYQYVVIYDPNGGFVTGSGWINSPLGAYTNDPTLMGKATFGFVSKYLKGANIPTGNTEFQFKVGNLNFKSTSYDWLVIAGTKAQYKGTGTINGASNYGFMLTATDGSMDKFRFKIWDKTTGTIIYDNMLNAADEATPTTSIQGGSIVIHK